MIWIAWRGGSGFGLWHLSDGGEETLCEVPIPQGRPRTTLRAVRLNDTRPALAAPPTSGICKRCCEAEALRALPDVAL